MKESASYKDIKNHINSIKIIDTHEHLPQEPVRLKQDVDVLATFFSVYTSSDLRSAGMSEENLLTIWDTSIPLAERWLIFEPWWEKMKNTGYSRSIEIAARDLYDIDGINSDTYKPLSENMKLKNKEGLYKWVLKDRSGIDMSINETDVYDVDREFFAPVKNFNEYLRNFRDRTDLENLGRQVGGPIHTFSDMVSALKSEFDKLAGKIVGVKIDLAYARPLHFEKVTFSEAEAAFNEIYKVREFRAFSDPLLWKMVPESPGFEKLRPMQDYLVHVMIEEAEKRRLPVQIHTGLQEKNENIISNSNPVLLVNLFMEYKDAIFDIFHGSWPYCGELGALAKNFPNVYIDMCWMHIISPSKARTALSDWLDEVPVNKILGFGGDIKFVEGVYGHSVIARENIARVLTSKVDDGDYGLVQAKKYASWLLRKNAETLFFNNKILS